MNYAKVDAKDGQGQVERDGLPLYLFVDIR